MIGETLGNYTITAKLGSGTMGVVFRAEHARIARTAAIKVLLPELAENASVLQRFFNEARATSLIRHPGIVEVLDCGVDGTGRAYIVMEHLEGETLADRLLRERSIPWAVACPIARQIAEAIGAAHDNAIVHRDLKPENVFLAGDRSAPANATTVKVLDFGIAKLRTANASVRLTMRGMVLGTPEYMSPEQCGGSEAIDGRADIYALGCILFEMLSGEPPFMAETVQELIVGHMFGAIPSIGERVPDLPAWLADLVTAMLAKRPEDRPAEMHDVAGALAAATAPAPPPKVERRARRAQIALTIAGTSALAAAVLIAGGAMLRVGPARPARAAAFRALADSERTTAPLARPAIVVPAPASASASIPAASVAPPAQTPARVNEPPRRPSRLAAPRPPRPRHVVDTDGIVDL
ncbi:MAG TPA: serine/threonine-protein kinase [Polyangia bacterium]|jgi:serine/threonine-protein kinase|nr:serine/threonine-protein kinase [Polyangia bacterium]